MTDEQELYMKDLYFRILFGIVFLEKSNYSKDEILEKFNYLFNEEKIEIFETKFSIVIDIIKEKFNQIRNDIKE